MVETWEQPATHEDVESRGRIPAWNVDTCTHLTVFLPSDRNTVRSVLRRDAENAWQELRANVAKPNETNTSDPDAAHSLRMERRRQKRGKDGRINLEINQDSAVYDTFNRWYFHE